MNAKTYHWVYIMIEGVSECQDLSLGIHMIEGSE